MLGRRLWRIFPSNSSEPTDTGSPLEDFPARLGYQNGQELIEQAVLHLKESIGTLCERTRSHLENALAFIIDIGKIPKQVQATVLGRISGVLRTCIDRMREMALYASREDLLENMGTFYGLSRFAAAASLEAGATPYEALKLLDEGRGIALSIQLDSRADDTMLEDADAELRAVYSEISEIRKKLLSCVEKETSLYKRHNLVQRVLDLQRQIRAKVPNFEACPSVESLKAMAQESAIVVVNVTNIRSDAFTISSDGIRVVPLTAIDEEDLSNKSVSLQDGLNNLSNDHVSRDTFSKMIAVLKILWKDLVHPVLKAIGKGNLHSEGTPWPRVCWIPTGVLSLYPIHAAGPYKVTRPQDAGAMSRVISSYAPTLKILHRTYSRHQLPNTELETRSAPARSLKAAVIAESKPPSDQSQKFVPLAAAERGTEIIQQTFSTLADDNVSLVIDHPIRSTVLDLLRRDIPIVQFFCHGTVDYDEPLDSKLFLDDWQANPLTVGALMKLDLRRSQLAFLSACWSAHGGAEKMQDEVNHLACGLQVAGFANVIGSLWEAVEKNMIELMEVFYQLLGDMEGRLTSRSIGEALHVAVMKVRESSCNGDSLSDPIYWAPFVRFGI